MPAQNLPDPFRKSTPSQASGSASAVQLQELASELLSQCEIFVCAGADLDTGGFVRRLRDTAARVRQGGGFVKIARDWARAALPAYGRLQRRAVAERENEMRRLLSAYALAAGDRQAAGSRELAGLSTSLMKLREAAKVEDIRELRMRVEESLREADQFLLEKEQAEKARMAALEEEVSALERALAAAREEMRLDPLTGSLHQGLLTARLQALLTERIPFTLAIFQIDDFDTIVRQLGPAQADAVMQYAAGELRRVSRSVDALGRWGDSRLALVLPGTSAEQATGRLGGVVARRSLRLTMDGSLLLVTFSLSCGLASSHGAERVDEVTSRAEAAVAEVLKLGGNGLRHAAGPDRSRESATAAA